ncbi:Anoctamin-5, partial [Orchesella cincta]
MESEQPQEVEDLQDPQDQPLQQIEDTNPDFVLIWDKASKVAMSPEGFERRSIFELNLQEEGLLLDWENSEIAPSLHVLKIWAPLEVLKRYSEILKFRLPIKQIPDCDDLKPRQSNRSDTLLTMFNYCNRIRRCISVDPDVFPTKCRKLTEIYSRDKEYLFDVNESNMQEIFPISVRARIVQFILKRTAYKSKSELELDAFGFGYKRLIQKEFYTAAYPLHDGKISTLGSPRHILYMHWARLSQCFKYQPLDEIKSYCGVNVALYFTWLGYYTTMLVFAAILGIFCFIYGLTSITGDPLVQDVCNGAKEYKMCPMCDRTCSYWKLSEKCGYSKLSHLFDNDFTVAFALLMSVWTAFFLEFWKRYVAKIAHQWDLTNFDLKDFTPRPEYIAELKKMYPSGTGGTDGEDERKRYDFDLRIPFWKKKLPFSLFSYSTVLLLVIMAFAVLIGVIVYRIWITLVLSELYSNPDAPEHDLAWLPLVVSISAACLNLTFIFLFGKIYQRLAERLTEMEFPRTPQDFEASYSLKIYLLEFMNNYSSIFYVAFFKGAFT